MRIASVLPAATLAAILCLSPGARAGEADQAELSAHLAENATALLDQILGPGRARVFVTMEGERSEQRTQSELLIPVSKKAEELALPPPPGYRVSRELMQRDQQQTARLSGFIVRRLQVSVLLDQAVAEERVEEVRRVLGELLRLSPQRGDSLVIIRAALEPAWRTLVNSPDLWKTLLSQAMLVTGLLLACGLGYLLALRLGRGFAGAFRMPPQEALRSGPPQPPPPRRASLPSLQTGPPSLSGALSIEVQPRFSYLASKPAHDVARLLQAESAQDAALLFSWLSDNNLKLGTLLFVELPKPFQVEVSKAMLRIEQADPERMSMLDSRLRTSVEFSLRGRDKLGTLLGRLDPLEREGLLEDLSMADAEGSEELRRNLVTFEDLAALENEHLRRLVLAEPVQIWAQALQGLEGKFADRVMGLLPTHLRPAFLEALKSPGSRESTLEARSRLLSRAENLASQGQLTLKTERQSS